MHPTGWRMNPDLLRLAGLPGPPSPTRGAGQEAEHQGLGGPDGKGPARDGNKGWGATRGALPPQRLQDL